MYKRKLPEKKEDLQKRIDAMVQRIDEKRYLIYHPPKKISKT